VISDIIGMLPAMTHRAYSPSARANASAKPVTNAGSTMGRGRDGSSASGRAERGGNLLQFALHVLEHRLNRPDDEREADESECDEHAERVNAP